MQKKFLLVFYLFSFFVFISMVSAQNIQRDFTDIGSNFETSCNEIICTTKIYSYDKYFDRRGTWELIDESWHNCEEGFCTNDYYFNATVDNQGLVKVKFRNGRFNQRIFRFGINNTFVNKVIDTIYWSLDFGESIINSSINITLEGSEESFIYVYYNYNVSGGYNIKANAYNGIYLDTSNITVNI